MVLDNPTTFEAWSSRLRKKPYFPNNPQQHRRSRAHKTMSQNKQCPKTMSQNNVAQNNVDQERTKQCPFHTLKSVPHLMWQNTLCDLYVTLCDKTCPFHTLKSVLDTNSKMRLGVFERGSFTTSIRSMMLGPPRTFCVCMCVCLYVCAHVCVRVCVYVCMCVHAMFVCICG